MLPALFSMNLMVGVHAEVFTAAWSGGIGYKEVTTNYVCNGREGPEGPAGPTGATGDTGPTGSPWTMDGAIPIGKTVMGHWAVSGSVMWLQQARSSLPRQIQRNTYDLPFRVWQAGSLCCDG